MIAGFQSLFANTNKGFIFAIIAWGLFIWAFSKNEKKKQKDRNRNLILVARKVKIPQTFH